MKYIYDFEIANNLFEIGVSSHAQKRMAERGITQDDIIDNILSLTTGQITDLNKNSLEAIVIDKESEVAVVIGFQTVGLVTVITVIKGDDIKVKPNTVEINI